MRAALTLWSFGMLSSISVLSTPDPLPTQPATGLSSGAAAARRIGAAAPVRDVFAGAVGYRLISEIGALGAASGNARDGAALLQVVDRELEEIDAALSRMKDLATQASSTTTPMSRGERAILNAEFQDLISEIDRIANDAKFNGTGVLIGGQLTLTVGTGGASEDSIIISLPTAAAANLDAGLVTDDLAAASGAGTALTNVNSAIDALDRLRASVRGSLVGVLGAQKNSKLGESVLTDLRGDVLAKPAALDTAGQLAKSVSEELLAPSTIVITGRISGAMRNLLMSSQLPPLGPGQAPDRTVASAQAPDDTRVKAPTEPLTKYENSATSPSQSAGIATNLPRSSAPAE